MFAISWGSLPILKSVALPESDWRRQTKPGLRSANALISSSRSTKSARIGSVSGARVRVTDEDGRRLSQWNNVRSGADGSFTYDGVGSGTYLVSAIGEFEGETLEAGERKVKVYEGGVGEVLLTLD